MTAPDPSLNQQLDFLGRLDTLLKRGTNTYRNYLANGKTLLYAKVLKDNNERIRELILKRAHQLPTKQQANALALVSHIDTWHTLWVDLANSANYNIQDEFAFENADNFPKQSVEQLMDYYVQLL